MIDFPRSVQTAWRFTAWLRGRLSADELIAALTAHEVVWYVPGPGQSPSPVIDVLAHLRLDGVTEVGATLPASGDPLGLGGPPATNLAALEAGQAVTGPGFVLIPEVVGSSVTWTRHPASPAPVPDLGEAARGIRQVVSEILRVSVMSPRAPADQRLDPELADELVDVSRTPELDPPDGIPPRAAVVAAQGWQALRIAALLEAADTGPVSPQMRTEIDRAARRALSAAATPACWPPTE